MPGYAKYCTHCQKHYMYSSYEIINHYLKYHSNHKSKSVNAMNTNTSNTSLRS